MRMMIVDPGFEYSTLAVAESLYRAFNNLGYEIMEYDTLKNYRIVKEGLKVNKKEVSALEMTDLIMSPIIKEIVEHRIDVVIMIHGYFMNPYVLNSIKSLGCKTAVVLTDDPMQVDVSEKWAAHYDFIFTNDRNTKFIHNGDKCHFLPMAVDNFIFNQKQVEEKYCSEILVGGSFYKERMDFLESDDHLKDLFLKRRTVFVGSRKLTFADYRLNYLFADLKISYEEMSNYVAGAICSIDIPKNEYIDGLFGQSNSKNIKASCLSPRIFECGASYTLPITTRDRNDINVLYPENLIPQFSSAEELEDILISLDYDKNLERKLNKIYVHTLQNHTYIHRAKEIERIMQISPTRKIVSMSFLNEKFCEIFDKDWKINSEYFMSRKFYTKENSIEKLKDVGKGQNLVIVSNGPSLEEHGAFIRKNKNDKIMCLNDATTLYEDICDYSVVIHYSKDVFDRCYDRVGRTFVRNIKLLASTVSYYECVRKWYNQNGEIYFFNTGTEGHKKEIEELTKYPIIPGGCTVGYTALCLAKYMGFEKITVYGLDCCFLKGKKYAYTPLKFSEIRDQNLIVAENSRGEVVLTDSVKMKTKELILKYIKENEDMKFNFSHGGLIFDNALNNLRNF